MKKRGFTLIELLIVMAVIAILVAIAVPAFRGMRQEAQITKSQGDLKVIKIALESYYKTNGSYPAVANYQTTLLAATPRILESSLNDPFTSPLAPYAYVLSANSRYYSVYSIGAAGDGSMVCNDDGSVSVEAGAPIWISNGYQP